MTTASAAVVAVQALLVATAGAQARRAARAARVRDRVVPAAFGRPDRAASSLRALLPVGRAGRDADVLPDVVDAFGGALGAGAPAADALEGAAGAAPPALAASLTEVALAVRRGRPLVESLEQWAASPGSTDGAGLVAAAVAIAAATGADPAAGLAGVASTLRERRSLAREVRALASQARASAVVIAIAPVGFALVKVGLGGDATPFLVASRVGLVCLGLGAALDAAGWRWMRRITESVA